MKKTLEIANVLLQDDQSGILLLQRSPRLKNPFAWGPPGGMIDEGESELRAATRELREETGISESDIAVLGTMKFLVEMPVENILVTMVHAKLLNSDTEIKIDPEEHIGYKWTHEDEIYMSCNLLPGLPSIVAKVLGRKHDFTDLTVVHGQQVNLVQ